MEVCPGVPGGGDRGAPGDRPEGGRIAPHPRPGNLAVELGPRSSLRAGWGRFQQSRWISELQVEDGVEEFHVAQRADHWSIALERRSEAGLLIRLEGYLKRIREPRTRYENVLDPLELFPEGKGDRIRINPDESESRGLELFAGYDGAGPVTGWASYALSKSEDRFDGTEVPRGWDQPHALNWNLNLGSGDGWNANLAGVHRSGWPTTTVTAAVVEGPSGREAVPVVGAFNGARYPSFHRVDLRLSRTLRLGGGSLALYFEVFNLLDHDNPCCMDGFDVRSAPEGGVEVFRDEDGFLPRIPSFGVTWRLAGD